jgi:hypothetical protein
LEEHKFIAHRDLVNFKQRQCKLEEECQLGYKAAKLLEEEERVKENQQLEEDQRMAELLSQDFILRQIVKVYLFDSLL